MRSNKPAYVLAAACLSGAVGVVEPAAADGGWELVLEFGNLAGDIAVDSSGEVYLLSGDGVQVFTADGEYLREFGPNDPRGIAIDEKDVVYVLSACRVVGYTTQGGPLLGWDSCIGQGDLQHGRGIDVRNGIAYVATVNNVLKFTTDGTLLDLFDYGWSGVQVVPDGSIWVSNADIGDGLVRHYSPDGDVLAEWPTMLPDEETSNPTRLVVDSKGRIFVNDDFRVKTFLGDGTLDDFIERQFFFPISLALDGDSILYVGVVFPDRVMKFQYKAVAVEPVTWGRIKSRYR